MRLFNPRYRKTWYFPAAILTLIGVVTLEAQTRDRETGEHPIRNAVGDAVLPLLQIGNAASKATNGTTIPLPSSATERQAQARAARIEELRAAAYGSTVLEQLRGSKSAQTAIVIPLDDSQPKLPVAGLDKKRLNKIFDTIAAGQK